MLQYGGAQGSKCTQSRFPLIGAIAPPPPAAGGNLNKVQNLNIAQSNDQFQSFYDVPNQFCITDDMPTIPEVLKHKKVIDISKSSCVEGINARFCKDAMLSFPAQIRKLCCTAFETGIIPTP